MKSNLNCNNELHALQACFILHRSSLPLNVTSEELVKQRMASAPRDFPEASKGGGCSFPAQPQARASLLQVPSSPPWSWQGPGKGRSHARLQQRLELPWAPHTALQRGGQRVPLPHRYVLHLAYTPSIPPCCLNTRILPLVHHAGPSLHRRGCLWGDLRGTQLR